MGINDIINSDTNKDLVADSIINIAIEGIAFSVKSLFISSLTVNNGRNWAFINGVNKTVKDVSCKYSHLMITRMSKKRIFGRAIYT